MRRTIVARRLRRRKIPIVWQRPIGPLPITVGSPLIERGTKRRRVDRLLFFRVEENGKNYSPRENPQYRDHGAHRCGFWTERLRFSARSAQSSRRPKLYGGRPTSTVCRGSRSSTRWIGSAPT